MKRLPGHLFLVLLIGLALSPGAALVARAFPRLHLPRLTDTALYGVTDPAKPPAWGFPALLSGAFQKSAAAWIDEQMGRPREMMIRLNNGIGYWAGRSFNPGVTIGNDRVLLPADYVRAWCTDRSNPQRLKLIAGQVAAITQIRDRVEASGRTFVLVLSPNKAAVYPEALTHPCAGGSPNQPAAQLRKALQQSGLNYIDSGDLLLHAKAAQTLPLFGRDGLHWNSLGAFHVADAIADAIESGRLKPVRHLRIKDIAVDSRPELADEDLGLLLNLPFRLKPYPSPHITFETDTTKDAPRVLMVGTSFCWQLLEMLGERRLSDDVTFYFYFSKVTRVLAGRRSGSDESFAAERDLPAAYARSDTVILDLNEANVLSAHIGRFAEALAGLTP